MNISPQTDIKVLISHRYVPEVTLKPSLPSCLFIKLYTSAFCWVFCGDLKKCKALSDESLLQKVKEVQATVRPITAVKS